MRRWLIWCIALGTAVVLTKGENSARLDIAKLEPAQVLLVEERAGQLIVTTDMGHLGCGRTLTEAVEDMKQTAAGVVFLDTAEYLLLAPSAEKYVPELTQLLRPSCRVCMIYGTMELKTAADYLSVHEPGLTLRDWKKNKSELPKIIASKGRVYLANP